MMNTFFLFLEWLQLVSFLWLSLSAHSAFVLVTDIHPLLYDKKDIITEEGGLIREFSSNLFLHFTRAQFFASHAYSYRVN